MRGVTPDNERRLFTLPLDETGKSSFELADIGELPEHAFRIDPSGALSPFAVKMLN